MNTKKSRRRFTKEFKDDAVRLVIEQGCVSHPFPFNMPKSHSIRAESVTDAYTKVVKFLGKCVPGYDGKKL